MALFTEYQPLCIKGRQDIFYYLYSMSSPSGHIVLTDSIGETGGRLYHCKETDVEYPMSRPTIVSGQPVWVWKNDSVKADLEYFYTFLDSFGKLEMITRSGDIHGNWALPTALELAEVPEADPAWLSAEQGELWGRPL